MRFRVRLGEVVALGPGKVDLLERIAATGSIAEAAKQLEMSYMRAWSLVRTMNRCFQEPVVAVSRGGSRHGGAQLSPHGRHVVDLYRRMEREAAMVLRPNWAELRSLLRLEPGAELEQKE